jgi:hypothetical protein
LRGEHHPCPECGEGFTYPVDRKEEGLPPPSPALFFCEICREYFEFDISEEEARKETTKFNPANYPGKIGDDF